MFTQSEISVDEGTFVFEIVPLCNSCWTRLSVSPAASACYMYELIDWS